MWRTRKLRNYQSPRCPRNGRDGRGHGRFLLFPSVACPARYLFTFAADQRPRRHFSHLAVNLAPVQNKHRNEVFGTGDGRHRSAIRLFRNRSWYYESHADEQKRTTTLSLPYNFTRKSSSSSSSSPSSSSSSPFSSFSSSPSPSSSFSSSSSS